MKDEIKTVIETVIEISCGIFTFVAIALVVIFVAVSAGILLFRGAVACGLNPIDRHETRFEIGVDPDTKTLQFNRVDERKKTFRGVEQ